MLLQVGGMYYGHCSSLGSHRVAMQTITMQITMQTHFRAFLKALDREALESVTIGYRRMVFGFYDIAFHEFILRHRALKSFSIGGSNTSWRLPEVWSSRCAQGVAYHVVMYYARLPYWP